MVVNRLALQTEKDAFWGTVVCLSGLHWGLIALGSSVLTAVCDSPVIKDLRGFGNRSLTDTDLSLGPC